MLIIASFSPCYSWGFYAHRLVNKMAVFTLPSGTILFFKQNVHFIEEHAVDADIRKHQSEKEPPRHYIDLEYYSTWNAEHAIDEIPKNWKQAVATYSEDSIEAWGKLPWAVKGAYHRLEKAFKEKDKMNALRSIADIGHYLSDAHVPLHTTINYDGQLTNQKGIHALWESRIPEASSQHYNFMTGKAKYIDDIDTFIWNIIFESHELKNEVLQTERELTKAYQPHLKYGIKDKYNKVKQDYSEQFILDYEKALNGMVEARMKSAIHAVGSLWFTAWVNAGQPNANQLK